MRTKNGCVSEQIFSDSRHSVNDNPQPQLASASRLDDMSLDHCTRRTLLSLYSATCSTSLRHN